MAANIGLNYSYSIPKSTFNSFKLHASSLDFPLASKIMVRNLPFSTRESCLEKQFSCFGRIAEVKLVKDETTKKSKGYAFIQYNSQDAALQALEIMDQQYFNGRVMYVELAKPETHIYGGYPKTSGPPPKENNSVEKKSSEPDEKEKRSSLDEDEPKESIFLNLFSS